MAKNAYLLIKRKKFTFKKEKKVIFFGAKSSVFFVWECLSYKKS